MKNKKVAKYFKECNSFPVLKDFTISAFMELQTSVTSAPKYMAICTTCVPIAN
jgi:hypothetical protein